MPKNVEQKRERLAVVDAGAQYLEVIRRRVQECSVECVLLPYNASPEYIKENFDALIISGGPQSVDSPDAPKIDPKILDIGIPTLAICYGMQFAAYYSDGKVEHLAQREDGPDYVKVDTTSPLFEGLNPQQLVLLTHGDTVTDPGEGFRVTAMSGDLIAGIENDKKKIYGVQFHPEVDLTEHGKQMIENFLYRIAGLHKLYTMEDREKKAIAEIRERVGNKYVLVLVSGGVDSAVAAALVTKALGKEKVFALHIDTGLMRKNESQSVKEALENLGLNLRMIHAAEQFLNATTEINGKQTPPLRECTDPEQKRKIIGDTFIRIAQQALKELGVPEEDIYLVQGTLRPDMIESASTGLKTGQKADTIKTHHNDSALARAFRDDGRIVEPLSDLHKDEVRVLGRQLGLPEDIVDRQPFPGPGLGVRVISAEKPYIRDDFDEVNEALKKFESDTVAATLLPIRTVGVQGDGRTYSYLAALSGEDTWEHLYRTAQAIPKTVHEVNRIVYVFGEKIEGPITEITPTHVTEETLEKLRHADAIVNEVLRNFDLTTTISQVPVILFPVPFGEKGNHSIGIRTIITNDFMTGVPAIPGEQMPIEALETIVHRILNEVEGISRVAYDLTSKPPGTTEWE